MAESHSNCRAESGVTVGIVDSIITMCRLFRGRDLSSHEVREALKDLSSDEDFAYMVNVLKGMDE